MDIQGQAFIRKEPDADRPVMSGQEKASSTRHDLMLIAGETLVTDERNRSRSGDHGLSAQRNPVPRQSFLDRQKLCAVRVSVSVLCKRP